MLPSTFIRFVVCLDNKAQSWLLEAQRHRDGDVVTNRHWHGNEYGDLFRRQAQGIECGVVEIQNGLSIIKRLVVL